MCSLTERTNAFLHVRRRRESDRKQTSEEEGLGRLHLGTKLGTGSRTAAKLHTSGRCAAAAARTAAARELRALRLLRRGRQKGGVRRITFIVMVVPEMERMEIDKDLDAHNKGKLRLPFHHKEDDGRWATATKLEASRRTERSKVNFP